MHASHLRTVLTATVLLLLSHTCLAQGGPVTLDVTGSIGGWVNTAYATGDYVYVGQANTLSRFVWSGDRLEQRSFFVLPNEPTQVVALGDRVFAAYRNTLEVVDFTDPAEPSLRATLGYNLPLHFIRGLDLQGGLLYVAQESEPNYTSFRIVDVAVQPPQTLRAVNVDGATDVAVSNGMAYLAAHTNTPAQRGLYLYDVSDPANPAQRGQVLIDGATRLDVEGNTAYVVGGWSRGLAIVDVSNPAAPVLLGTFEDGTSTFTQVDARGTYVYLLDDQAQLRILDVTNRNTPQPASTLDPAFPYTFATSVQTLVRDGKTKVVATADGTLKVVDATQPAQPVLLADAFLEPSDVRSLSADAGRLVLAGDDAAWLYDVAGGALPAGGAGKADRVIPGLHELRARIPLAGSNQVLLDGDRLYAADWGDAFTIFDVTDAGAPVQQGVYHAATIIKTMDVRDDVLYLVTSDWKGGVPRLEVVDVSDPDTPARLGAFNLPDNGIDLFVPPAGGAFDHLVYTVYYDDGVDYGGVQLLDVTNPLAVTVVSTIVPAGAKPTAVSGLDHYLAIGSMTDAEDAWYIQVFDVTDPANPVGVGSTAGAGSALWDLTLLPDLTLVASFPDLNEIRGFDFGLGGTTARAAGTPTPGRATIYHPLYVDFFRESGAYDAFAGKSPQQDNLARVFFSSGSCRYGSPEASGSLGEKTVDYPLRPQQPSTLVLGMPPAEPVRACPPAGSTDVAIGQASLTATGTAWIVGAIRFDVPPEARSLAAEIAEAWLLVRGQHVTGTLATDAAGRVTSAAFDLGDVRIEDGETLQLTFHYRLAFPSTPSGGACPLEGGRSYQVETSVENVAATPVPEAARPGRMLPEATVFTSGLLAYDCVRNVTRMLSFGGIQAAVDDAGTQAGDEIAVCPGRYPEAVAVHKPLTIHSTDGPAVTEVHPTAGKAAAGDVFTLTAGGTILQGFTITGGERGVYVDGADGCLVGALSDLPRLGNVVTGNATGIVVRGTASRGVRITGNAIFENDGLGIDLGDDGPTPNDLGDGQPGRADADAGPNALMNFPVGVVALPHATQPDSFVVTGLLDTAQPATATVDLYASPAPDPSGFGEGRHYVGSATPDTSGFFHLVVARADLAHPFLSATATDADGSTSEFSPVCGDPDGDGLVDSDGDGLCDDWEAEGIDYDGDGTVDLPLHAAPFDAGAGRRDLFVEVDWMRSPTREYRPRADGLQDVADAFLGAPVANPDGTTGIVLHAMTDEAVPEVTPLAFDGRGPGTFHGVKYGAPANPCGTGDGDGHFGTRLERESAGCAAVLGARRLAFRYVLFGHEHAELPGSSGIAALSGADGLVTVGVWDDETVKYAGGYAGGAGHAVLPAARRRTEAGAFMHTLGHLLGLRHGGGDDVGCKPNYLSVMNHALQFRHAVPTRPLVFSGTALPDLDETALDERLGLQGPAGWTTLYNQSGTAGVAGLLRVVDAGAVDVDWNGLDADGDGDAGNDPSVRADINYMPTLGCSDGGFSTLVGWDDWSALRYGVLGTPGAAPPARNPGLTEAQVRNTAHAVDFDDDGLVNAVDNCSYIPNPDQTDGDGDGVGDVCEGAAVDLSLAMRATPEPATAHEPMTCTLTVFNAGPDASAAVTLHDSLGAGLSLVSATPGQGECHAGAGGVVCELGGLAAGDHTSVEVVVMPEAAGTAGTWVTVASLELDTDPADNRLAHTVVILSGTPVEPPGEVPEAFHLHANYPNPFNATTQVPFDVREPVRVVLKVYNVLGQEVATLLDGARPPGRHEVRFDAGPLPTGVYFCRIEMGDYTAVGRMVLLR